MEFNMNKVKVGMIVEGTVFKVTDDSVYLDIQAFTEGVIHKKALSFDDISSCKEIVKEGDVLKAKIHRIEYDNQQILLSRLDILRQENTSKFGDLAGKNERIKAKVKMVTRGGLVLTKDNVELFMPLSQIDIERVNAEDFKGKTLECKVIESDGRKVVVSRKRILEEDRRAAKSEEFDTLKLGQIIEGVITKITSFGAFVKIGHNEGLVHISQISHHKVEKVEDVLKEGDTVKTEIINLEKRRIGLSMKKLLETPWQLFGKDNKVGDKISCKITRKMAKGMLVEVARDVVGIINNKDYSWDPKDNLAGEVEVGDKLDLQILSIDASSRKLSLSKKHLSYNPWNDVTLKEGEETSGIVEEIQSKGALVKIQGVKAFLPIGELSSERVSQVADVLKFNDVVNVVVIEVNKTMWKMVVSIKQLLEDKQKKEFADYKKTEEKAGNQTLGDLFGDKFREFR